MPDEKPLVLIVDDEKNTSRTMAMALEAVGYATEEAETTKAALEFAIANHPKLIVLDYHMPDIDGLTALRMLRKDPWGKDAAVIIASNVYDVDIINSIMELGVQDYVLKADVNLDEIVKLVGSYVPLGQPPQTQ
jgi:CheY-like chemotaxis protein